MGFGKWLGGAICAVGAVVAAPVVLPALASTAVGAAVTGAVSAAGTAIASTAVGGAVATAAGAVTTAATATAAAVGTAVTSTAVGGAVVGATTAAVTAVGTGVAGAAGAVGLTAVGASTSAAALGTSVIGAAIGGATLADGIDKTNEAKKIASEAKRKYDSKYSSFKSYDDKMKLSMHVFGEKKATALSALDKFVSVYSKVKRPPKTDTIEILPDELTVSVTELKDIKAVALSMQDLIQTGAVSYATGGFIGLATSGAVINTITYASTGAAISGLSGAASQKAILAALGGGAKSMGGAGIAGGKIMLNCLKVAPMLAVSGIMLSYKGRKALEEAEYGAYEVEEAIKKMDKLIPMMRDLKDICDNLHRDLCKCHEILNSSLDILEKIVDYKTYKEFNYYEKKALEKSVGMMRLIKLISTQNILSEKQENTILTSEIKKVQTTVKENFADMGV